MNDSTLMEYYNKLIPFYKIKNYDAALRLVTEAETKLPHYFEHISYWRCCILSASGKVEDAISLFNKLIDEGIWWPISSINSEPDFDNLRNTPDFVSIVDRIDVLAKEKQLRSKPQLFFFPKTRNKVSIVNIHWKDDTVAHYRKYFDTIYEKTNCSCLYVQSSQVTSSIGFGWDNQEKALFEIEETAKQFLENCKLICGTSQGARIAFLLSQKYKKNYLGVIPAFSEKTVSQFNNFEDVKYRFIVGDSDYYTRFTNELVRLLEKSKVDIQLVVMKDMEHYFPANFGEYYQKAIEGTLT